MSSTKRTIYVALALLTAIVLAYSHVWHCDFIDYDDNNHVFDNEHVRGGLSVANVTWAFTQFHASQWIPLTWISFMTDVSLFGLEPGPMHLVNVGFHYLNTLLLFGVLWQMTGAFWRSACVGAFFALHPINVETVAWITERKSLINTTLWLLAICCHVRYVANGNARWIALTFACMAMGVMTKAMIVTLPFTLLLLDVWPLRRIPATTWQRLVSEKALLFALTAIACVIQMRAGMASGLLWTAEMAPIPFRIACAFTNVLHYVCALIYPAKLSIQYPVLYEAPYALAAYSAACISLFLLYAWRARVRAPYLLLGGLWFLGTMVPVIGIVRAGDAVFADRYTYVPQIGLFVAAVWSIEALCRQRWRPAVAITAGVAFAVLTSTSARYVNHWTSTATLFSHAATTWPTSIRAQELAANAYTKLDEHKLAAHHLEEILRIAPGSASHRNSYGLNLAKTGKIEAAISQFRLSAMSDPSLVAARFNLGTHLILTDDGAAEAVTVLRKITLEDPSFTAAYYWLGVALEAEGQYEEASEAYQQRLMARPRDISARNALARVVERQSIFKASPESDG